jgi:hypothetical protein
VRELEDFGVFHLWRNRHGMVLHTRQIDRDWGVFIRGLSSFIVFWTSFGGIFGKTGGWKGNLIVLEKQQTSFTHNTLSSHRSLLCS